MGEILLLFHSIGGNNNPFTITTMSIERVIDLTVKELSASITQDEEAELMELKASSAEHVEAYDEAVKSWKKAGGYTSAVTINTEKSWNRFQSELTKETPAKVFDLRPFFKVAAAILVAISLSVVVWNPWGSVSYTTGIGEVLEVTLADQSVITLNESSTLLVSKSFNEIDRRVEFDGEAYFDIAEDENKAFIIQSNQYEIAVLGTSFNVDAKNGSEFVEVDVTSGRVSLTEIDDESNQILLTKGMKGSLNPENNKLVAVSYENENFQAWRTKQLQFDDLRMQEVIQDMEEYFGESISISNAEILSCNFTSTFDEPSLEEVLEILSLTLDLSYQKEGEIYIITGNGCSEIQE